MAIATYVLIAFTILAAVYVTAKAAGAIRRVGLWRLLKATSALTAGIALAFGRLFGRRDRASGVIEASGDALKESDHSTKAWDKVGSVSVPEQYVHHADPEVSGLAQAHLDDD